MGQLRQWLARIGLTISAKDKAVPTVRDKIAKAIKKAAPKAKAPKAPKVAPKKAAHAKSSVLAKPARPSTKTRYNAETMRVIREANAGRNLHRYGSVDELFKALGD